MKHAFLLICILSLTGCGVAKRFIPKRPSPRVIITGGHFAFNQPCRLDDADQVLALYYGHAAPVRQPS